ncbi:hypothetical protein V1477_012917 [Vespula maculifrons]|uniref:Uncharacterized protein n=1 Tax=Vespula maculifrons TaxID=7453 RepID=A0ABD2BUF3_VESMC
MCIQDERICEIRTFQDRGKELPLVTNVSAMGLVCPIPASMYTVKNKENVSLANDEFHFIRDSLNTKL